MTATTSRLHGFLQYLEVEDGPQRRVDRAYRRLGSRTRREVIRLARQGRPHPDPYVSSVALAWARQMRSQLGSDLVTSAVGVILIFVAFWIASLWVHWLLIGPGGAFLAVFIPGTVLGQNRLAKKVEAANR